MSRLLKLFDLFAAAFWEPIRHELAGIAYPTPRPAPPPEPGPVARPQIPPTPIADPPPAGDTPAALYVRVGAGRGSRYKRDDGSTQGPKFRRVPLASGRTKYLLA